MLIHLSNIIQRGVIDNTVRGLTDLRLWYSDESEPLHFIIVGDCCSDIAGCRVSFTNRVAFPSPGGDWQSLEEVIRMTNEFTAGDITMSHASRDEDNRRAISRSISIEFFSDVRVRIVIDVDYFDFEISLAQWKLSWEEDNLRALIARDQLRAHVVKNVELHSLFHMATDASDFRPCSWDKMLNKTEARAAIFRTVRHKYIGEQNSLASIAYVLDMPQLLGVWAQLDKHFIPRDVFKGNKPKTLFDYLEDEHKKPVQKAMQHPLFHYTSKLTEVITPALQQLMETDNDMGDTVDSLMQKYARIVSRILASILLLQQSPDKQDSKLRETLIWRINHLQKRLIDVRDNMPKETKNLDRIQRTIQKIKEELEEFRHEVSR